MKETPAQTSTISRSNQNERPSDFDALPKRFRDYIRGLENDIAALRKTMDAEGETRVTLESYSRTFTPRYLPNDARIVFALPDARGQKRRVELQLDRGRGSSGVQVSSPDGRIVVLPQVSNEICVRVGDI